MAGPWRRTCTVANLRSWTKGMTVYRAMGEIKILPRYGG
jgi:hypothetical protein